MRLNYYPETDSLYIDLSEQASAESREISEGIILDYVSESVRALVWRPCSAMAYSMLPRRCSIESKRGPICSAIPSRCPMHQS